MNNRENVVRTVVISLLLGCYALSAGADHGIALYGEPKYGPDFEHFDYVNPDAPKGGEYRTWSLGTFNDLNGFILKGESAAGITAIYDSLAVGSLDEPSSVYGLLAESIDVPDDRMSVSFTLREEARFHDGEPVEPHDVIWTFNTLLEKGHPFFRVYYGDVDRVEQTGEREVTFFFKHNRNRELPMILASLSVLPEHYWQDKDFAETTMEPPLGSGPYRVKQIEQGRYISYERVPDYWAADLPVNRGQNNFDVLRFEYFRDTNAAMEAFKAAKYDFREEHVAKIWATGYDFPAVNQGLVKKELVPHDVPQGMQAFFMNSRRPYFADPQVRRALAYAFDFDWTNRTLFYDAYTRTESYFANSDLAAGGLPEGAELEVLQTYRDQLPAALFEEPYTAPRTDGSGNIRGNLRIAAKLLEDAGWVVKDGVRVNAKTGQAMEFEIMISQPSMERVINPFVENLKRLGVVAKPRTVDASQYENRMEQFDFDMTTLRFTQSLTPGNELRSRFGSAAADTLGSNNYLGVKDPVVDAIIDDLLQAETREALVAHSRALDRVLLWGHYVIPHWHLPAYRMAYWDRFGKPAERPKYGMGTSTWWLDPDKDAAVRKAKGN